jgi:hypothetical protein
MASYPLEFLGFPARFHLPAAAAAAILRAGGGRGVTRMGKPRINAPARPLSDPGYCNECQFALEPSFTRLHEEAVKAGWEDRQVVYALMLLAARSLGNMEQAGAPEEREVL